MMFILFFSTTKRDNYKGGVSHTKENERSKTLETQRRTQKNDLNKVSKIKKQIFKSRNKSG